jgi:tetratricopeptide (TPR) repeat protein
MKLLLAFVVLLLLPLFVASGQSHLEDSNRAQLLFEQKQYADAAAILERFEHGGTAAPADLVLLGMCYTEMKELDKAAAVLDMAALMEPRSVSLIDAQGNLAFVRKHYSTALDLFRRAHEIDPRDRNAVQGMVASLANYGVEVFGQGKPDEARKLFLEAVQLDPLSVSALRNIGVLELETGNPLTAAAYLEKALVSSPRDVGLLKLLFLARNRLGESAAMLPILDQLIEVQPADPEPYALKGRLLEQQGDKQGAQEAFGQAAAKGSQDPLPYLRVGEAQRSRYVLHDAIGKSVQLISALQIQASQALGRARTPEDLNGARLAATKVEDVRATLVSALTLLREIDGENTFQEDLVRLQSWYPGSVDLSAALARLFGEKERWPDSLAAWQRILSDHPLDEEAQAGSGLAFEKLGDQDQAVIAYRRARELAPGSADIYAALERVYNGRENELREVLLDASYRETRNAVLFRELAKLEGRLGMDADAAVHSARVAQIESGK